MQTDLVLSGMAENPALPDDMRRRLLRRWPVPVAVGLVTRDDLTLDVQEQLAAHPSATVRGVFVRYQPMDPAIRDRLLDDPEWSVRSGFLETVRQPPLPDEALTRLLSDVFDTPEPWSAFFTISELLDDFLFTDGMRRVRVAVRHPDRRARVHAAGYACWADLQMLAADPDPEVSATAVEKLLASGRPAEPADLPPHHTHGLWWMLGQQRLSRALAEQVAAAGDLEAVRCMARNRTLPADMVQKLSGHTDIEVRAEIARRGDLTAGQIERLGADPAEQVRTAVATHAYLTEKERDILARAADLDPGEAARWARSENPRLRRWAARSRQLPADLVTVLAEDPDAEVRENVALHQVDAPAGLLLATYLADSGQSALLSRPRFPAAGLARFADDPDPHLRLLATLDPEVDPTVVDRLTADPHRCVAQWAACSRYLPVDRLLALLDDPDLARYAAANPALPWEQVYAALCESADDADSE
ncbi:hypothetical protein Q0Z83_049880 [Actinoplanes sichuanensis]|uniref:Leucine rich repeat variant n=1 Tax=Actinoplanes sichuanensis TaxID=512349 RepID=A0ABW4APY9_9ACTN|nr:hypothetical protein [Actinoplanes sichuanensis]BEL06797.1 hypothetical protein Q0Z83_049880 [Actinoplanes sichuanensis]